MATGDAEVAARLDGLDAHLVELSEQVARLDELIRAAPPPVEQS